MPKEHETISLVDEHGDEHEFSIVDVIEVNDRRYAILEPTEGEESEAVIFRVEDDETLSTVDDEEEYEQVAQALEDMGAYGPAETDDEEDDEDEEEDEDLELDEEEVEPEDEEPGEVDEIEDDEEEEDQEDE